MSRWHNVKYKLSSLGFIVDKHSDLCIDLINAFGLLRISDEKLCRYFDNPRSLRHLVCKISPKAQRNDVLILLDCLEALARIDGRPLLLW